MEVVLYGLSDIELAIEAPVANYHSIHIEMESRVCALREKGKTSVIATRARTQILMRGM
jgi:hypothetical protein